MGGGQILSQLLDSHRVAGDPPKVALTGARSPLPGQAGLSLGLCLPSNSPPSRRLPQTQLKHTCSCSPLDGPSPEASRPSCGIFSPALTWLLFCSVNHPRSGCFSVHHRVLSACVCAGHLAGVGSSRRSHRASSQHGGPRRAGHRLISSSVPFWSHRPTQIPGGHRPHLSREGVWGPGFETAAASYARLASGAEWGPPRYLPPPAPDMGTRSARSMPRPQAQDFCHPVWDAGVPGPPGGHPWQADSVCHAPPGQASCALCRLHPRQGAHRRGAQRSPRLAGTPASVPCACVPEYAHVCACVHVCMFMRVAHVY